MSSVSSRFINKFLSSPAILNRSSLSKSALHNARFSPAEQYSTKVVARREKSIEGASHILPKDFYMPAAHTKGRSFTGEGAENNWRALLGPYQATERLERSATVREAVNEERKPSLLSRLRRTKSFDKLTQTDPPIYKQPNWSSSTLQSSSSSDAAFDFTPAFHRQTSQKAPSLYKHPSGASSWNDVSAPSSPAFTYRSTEGLPSPSSSTFSFDWSRPTTPFQHVNLGSPQGVARPYASSFAHRPYNHFADSVRNDLAWKESRRQRLGY